MYVKLPKSLELMSKPVTSDIEQEDDMEAFDSLEKNFHNVIQELITDRTLTKFRDEYEKLHDELVKSHENNQVLIDKCRDMNNNILANANKVSSVLQLSQNDQRTIAGLRSEFEKAWKMVEVSQDREVKSKEAISTLKDEISTLARLVEQGGTAAMTQQTSLQEIVDSIAVLKKEVAIQEQQIATIQNQKAESQALMMDFAAQIEQLEHERETLTASIQQMKTDAVTVSNDVDQLAADISSAKTEIKTLNVEIEQNDAKIKEVKDQTAVLDGDLWETKRDLLSAEEDLRANRDHIKTVKKVLDERIKATNRTREDMAKYDDVFARHDKTYEGYTAQLNTIVQEKEATEVELAEHKQYRQELINEKKRTRDYITQCTRQRLKLGSDETGKKISIQLMRSGLDRDTTTGKVLKSKYGKEKADYAALENQTKLVSNEMLVLKAQAQEYRAKIATVNDEAIEYQTKYMHARNNTHQIREDIKAREALIDEGIKKAADLEVRQKHQNALLDSLQVERDMACMMVQTSVQENEVLRADNEALAKEILSLKEGIRMKDAECVETHFKQKKTCQSVKILAKEVKIMTDKMREMDESITEVRNLISRARHLLAEAEMDKRNQAIVISNITMSTKMMERTSVNRVDERDMLIEKARVLVSLIEKGRARFEAQEDEIEKQQEIFDMENAKLDVLMNNSHHSKALRLECIRIEKALLHEQGKCKALEQEMEKPMNVHRWRFLDSTNPEQAQMIRMNTSLRDKLMDMIYKLGRLQKRRDDLLEQAAKKERQLENSYGYDYYEEKAYLMDLLKQKNQALKQMQTQASEQGVTVMDTREHIMNVRTMVREEKTELYDAKKRVDRIRAKTAMGTRPKTRVVPTTPRADGTRFIGGGFAVGGTLSPTASPAKDKSPQLVLPVSSSPRRNRMTPQPKRTTPRGWTARQEPQTPYRS